VFLIENADQYRVDLIEANKPKLKSTLVRKDESEKSRYLDANYHSPQKNGE
jgi:hypothetical protein